jgi:hypothetical protein
VRAVSSAAFMSTYCALVVRYFMNSAVVAPARRRITTARRTETGFLMMHAPCVTAGVDGYRDMVSRTMSDGEPSAVGRPLDS